MVEDLMDQSFAGGSRLGLPGGATMYAPAPPERRRYLAEPEGEPRRDFGFRSGNLASVPTATRHLVGAAVAGAGLGEPTSYAGGEGVPGSNIPPPRAPIGVLRGTTRTFVPQDTGEAIPTEYASALQARQATNRARQIGEYRPAGAELAEIRAREIGAATEGARRAELTHPQYVAQAAVIEQQRQDKIRNQNISDLNKKLSMSSYGKWDAKQKQMVFEPEDESAYRDKVAAEGIAGEHGAEAGRIHFDERQMARKWLQTQPLPTGFDANAYLEANAANPQAWADLMAKVHAAGIAPGAPQPTHWYNRIFGTTPQAPVQAQAPVAGAPTPTPQRDFGFRSGALPPRPVYDVMGVPYSPGVPTPLTRPPRERTITPTPMGERY